MLCQFTVAFLACGELCSFLGTDSQAIRGLYASVQFSDKVVFLPGVGQRLALLVQTVLNPVQIAVMDVDMPAVGPRLALMVQTVKMPVEVPQVPYSDKEVLMPVFCACALRCLVVVTVSLLMVLTILHGTA